MLNPFRELAAYYIAALKRWSPVKVHTMPATVAISVLSKTHRTPRTITFFGSVAELSVSHRAPGAYFSDEIRVRDIRETGNALRVPRWADGRTVRGIGPLCVIADTAARQAKCYAAFAVESAAEAARTPMSDSVYTLASREVPAGCVINTSGGQEAFR